MMFTERDYRRRYQAMGLSAYQKEHLLSMLTEMLQLASSEARLLERDGKNRMATYFAGKTDGLNSAYHLIAGTLGEHDEFGD